MHFLVSIEIIFFYLYLIGDGFFIGGVTLRCFVIYIVNLFLQNIAKDLSKLLTQ